jgi:hypothetical protein
MDMVFEVYDKALKNDDPDFDQVLYYAARDAFKTLGAAILEVLAVLHLDRDVAHMAAIESQSRKSQQYVKKFLSRPLLRDYIIGDNQEITWVVRYHNAATSVDLTAEQYAQLSSQEKGQYEEIKRFIRIVICTVAGANSEHVPFFCVEGDTRILAKVENAKRDRKAFTARGLFRRLKGLSPGGRSGGETRQSIVPVERIELLALDLNTGLWKFEPIVRAECSEQETLRLRTSKRDLVCTASHPVYVLGRGFVQAGDVQLGDRLISVGRAKTGRESTVGILSAALASESGGVSAANDSGDPWDQVVLGGLLGSCMLISQDHLGGPHLIELSGAGLDSYLAWKREFLSQKLRTADLDGLSGFRSGKSPVLRPYDNFGETLAGVERLRPLGLAVWYMDAGCAGNGLEISSESFTKEQNEYLVGMLRKNFGLETEVFCSKEGCWAIRGDVAAKRRLAEICAPFIHPDMAYKFDLSGNREACRVCGAEYWHYQRSVRSVQDCGRAICRLIANEVLAVEEVIAKEEAGKRFVYDFTLESTHNYVSNGILSHNCIDEVDVVPNPRAYDEAKMIPAPRDGKMPITVLISTRKFSVGLVQKEIDRAKDTRLQIRHWNIIDVTEACPPERHKPELPRLTVYRNSETLEAVTPEKYEQMSGDRKVGFVKDENVLAGCSTCKLYPMCEGRLATKQTSKSSLLKPINHTINVFSKVSVATAQAQLLCKKPSSEGLIFPQFDRDVHMLTAAQMAEKITGEKYHENMTKQELLAVMKNWSLRWGAGMDFGYSHRFAVVAGATDGYRAFIVHVVSEPGLDPTEQVEICKKEIRPLDPSVYPDPENPQMIATLRKPPPRGAGLRMKAWAKGPGSVIGGIDVIRMLLRPAIGEPRLFLLKDDEGCELLAKRFSSYHWKLNPDGTIGKHPDEEDDDECFTYETEVLTKDGWKSLAEVTPKDGVMAVTEDGVGQWENPEVIAKDYVGPMYSVKHNHLEFTATAGHSHGVMRQIDWKVNGQYRLVKRTVDEMAGEMYWANNLASWPSGEGAFEQGVDEAWMAGFWVAEGCFDSGRPTFIIVDQSKPENQDRIRECASRLGWTWSETICKKQQERYLQNIRFVFSGQKERAAEWRETFGSGAKNKKLPVRLIMQMTQAEREAFWEGYMTGDGARTGTGWHFDSISEDLVNSIQVLTMALGYGCRIVSYDCMREGREMVNGAGNTYLGSKSYRGHVLRRKSVAHIDKKLFTKGHYGGRVYCVRTSTGFFLARSAGKPFVAGNCDASRYWLMNEFSSKGAIKAAQEGNQPGATQTEEGRLKAAGQKLFRDILRENGVEEDKIEGTGRGSQGSFKWDIG